MINTTLDFETYFDKDYTLSNMTTEAYVRDPRFKVHCLGFKGAADLTITMDEPRGLYIAAIRECAVLCHHAHFDGLILSHHYGIKPAFWFDTLSMARLVLPHLKSHSLSSLAKHFGMPEKTVPYNLFKGVRDLPLETYKLVADGCAHDVELTYQIFQKLLPLVPPSELRLIDLTIRMFTEPSLVLDRDLMMAYQAKDIENKKQLMAQLEIGKADLMSADKFAELIREAGEDPPTKISPATKKEIYAFAKTDVGFQNLIESDNQIVAALAECRLAVKTTIVETRSQRLLDSDKRGAMPVYLKYCGAHTTTRWSGGDGVNWQNFPRDSDMRRSIMAPEGYVLCVVDAAQIEARYLNWFYGQWDILQKFANGEDIYSQLATQFYKEHVDKSKPEKRGTGKQIELSCGYRAGTDSIQETARRGTYGPPVMLTKDEAKRARDLYRNTHPRVKIGWEDADLNILPALMRGDTGEWNPGGKYALQYAKHKIFFPGGAWMDYSNLHVGLGKYGKPGFFRTTRAGVRAIHGGILTQNIMEFLARQFLAESMLHIAQRYKVILCTHDEIVYLAEEAEAEQALKFGLKVMSAAPAWAEGLPLAAEGDWDVRYSK